MELNRICMLCFNQTVFATDSATRYDCISFYRQHAQQHKQWNRMANNLYLPILNALGGGEKAFLGGGTSWVSLLELFTSATLG